MTNLTSVGITAGIPTTGTGTVSTLDNLPNLQLTAQIGNGTNTAAIKAASVNPVSSDPALVVTLSPNGINSNGQALSVSSAPVVIASDQTSIPVTLGTVYPTTATPVTASATGTTAATTATLAAVASKTTYLTGFAIRANATAAATGNATVTGTISGTLNFTQWTAPAASGLGEIKMEFNPPIPSSAVNTAIAVVSAAPGTAGIVSVTAWGYYD